MSGAGAALLLVRGVGGRPGLAFHAGALLALQAYGLAAQAATTITGTSAGAIATAIVAAGGAVEDLVDYTSAAAPREEFRDMGDLIHAADRQRQRIEPAALGRLIDLRGARQAVARAAPVALLPPSPRWCRACWTSGAGSPSSTSGLTR